MMSPMVYRIAATKRFDKDYAKLSTPDRKLAKAIINRLANDEILEPKYKDALLLTAFRINSHSELF